MTLNEIKLSAQKNFFVLQDAHDAILREALREKKEETLSFLPLNQPPLLLDYDEELELSDEGEEPLEQCADMDLFGDKISGPMPRRKGRAKGRRGRGRGGRGRINTRPLNMRGVLTVAPRENNVWISDEVATTIGSATVLNPYNYMYFNLTYPLAWNGGSATTPALFSGQKANYRKARVKAFVVTIRAVNNETFPGEVSITPVNFLPPNTLAQNVANVKNPMTRKKIISSKGGMDKATVVYRGSTRSFGGFASTNVEDNFVFNTDGSSPPTDNVYAAILVDTAGLAAFAGVTFFSTIRFLCDFAERQTSL